MCCCGAGAPYAAGAVGGLRGGEVGVLLPRVWELEGGADLEHDGGGWWVVGDWVVWEVPTWNIMGTEAYYELNRA